MKVQFALTDEDVVLLSSLATTDKKNPTVADRYAQALDKSVNDAARAESRLATSILASALVAERVLVERGAVKEANPETILTLFSNIADGVDFILEKVNLSHDDPVERAKNLKLVVEVAMRTVITQTIAANA